VRKSNPKGGKTSERTLGKLIHCKYGRSLEPPTAAPTYFKDIKFKLRSAEGATKIDFSDGGFVKPTTLLKRAS